MDKNLLLKILENQCVIMRTLVSTPNVLPASHIEVKKSIKDTENLISETNKRIMEKHEAECRRESW